MYYMSRKGDQNEKIKKSDIVYAVYECDLRSDSVRGE